MTIAIDETTGEVVAPDPDLRARVESILAKRKGGDTGGNGAKRGRKKKSEPVNIVQESPEAAPPRIDLDTATAVYAPVTFAFLAPFVNRIDAAQPYTMDEAAMLTRTVLALNEKYPDFQYGEELAVVLVLGAQFGGRYLSAAAKRKAEQTELPLGREVG